MWLIVRQMPIKAEWRDVSLALWDFSRRNKHYIHLSATKTIYFSRCPYCNVRISVEVVWSCSLKMLFVKIFQNSQVFHLAQKFPVNFAKFWGTPFSTEHSSDCSWLLHQSRFPILILYVINWQLRLEYV